MTNVDEIRRHLDRNDKVIAKMDKLIRKYEDRLKRREIEHSQLAFAFQKANDIVKHLVLQNYLLQKRTGGTLTNEELIEGQKELQSEYDKRKKSLKSISLQPKQPGHPKRGG